MDQIYAYVDGGYLENIAPATPWLEPWMVCTGSYQSPGPGHPAALGTIDRLNFYDAEDPAGDPKLGQYLNAIQKIPHCSVRRGSVRTGSAGREQKGVDVLLAVEMLTDAQAGNFAVALLLAGDADFVPLVDAVRRYGTTVVVIAAQMSLADKLRQAADEVWLIDPAKIPGWELEF